MLEALNNEKYDKNVVLKLMEEKPDVVSKLATYKTPHGSTLFTPKEIVDILYNCKGTVESNSGKIYEYLDNPKYVDFVMD